MNGIVVPLADLLALIGEAFVVDKYAPIVKTGSELSQSVTV